MLPFCQHLLTRGIGFHTALRTLLFYQFTERFSYHFFIINDSYIQKLSPQILVLERLSLFISAEMIHDSGRWNEMTGFRE